MPTKPSKFATEAADNIVGIFPFPKNLMFSPGHIFSAAQHIDQSFSEARTAFEELAKKVNAYIQWIPVEASEKFGADEEHRELLTAHIAAQKILKEWKGE